MIRTYTEILQFEEAFKSFLILRIRKQELKIHYYVLYDSAKANHYSFVGYQTNHLGLHGIHYNRTTNMYYFGTLNNKIKSEIHRLMDPQVMLIPAFVKDGLLDVAINRRAKIIKREKL